ncbi:hypothetical protein QR680_009693 [Steinernema hermaphroditum]|uniref:Uncharacterized protein n=1 Tax=Steinernema hermaphroditum TaxID=289476 RepID=A0AA39ILB8_9BILA|nr:hypothetical protein QR680_009693 [Steinernema hermaphroditum]
MEKWERELCELFSARSDEKKKFVDFFNRRMHSWKAAEGHCHCHALEFPRQEHMALDSLIGGGSFASTRSENNKLKSELALKEAQIAAVKMRKTTIEQKTIQLQQRENEVEAKWQVIYEKTRNLCQSQAPAVVIEEGPLPSPSLPNGGSRLQHQRSFRYGSVVHDQARSLQQNSPLMQPSMSLSSMQNFFAKTESKEVKKKSKK